MTRVLLAVFMVRAFVRSALAPAKGSGLAGMRGGVMRGCSARSNPFDAGASRLVLCEERLDRHRRPRAGFPIPQWNLRCLGGRIGGERAPGGLAQRPRVDADQLVGPLLDGD